MFIVLAAVTLAVGCTMTTKQSKDDIQAQNATMAAELAAMQGNVEQVRYVEALLNELRKGEYHHRVQASGAVPVQYQTQPQVVYQQPQQQQPQVIYMPAPQQQQPQIIYMQPQPGGQPQTYPYPFVPSCGCDLQSNGSELVCPCPLPSTNDPFSKQ